MPMLPQGTQLYALMPKDAGAAEVIKVACALTVDTGEDERDEHDDTCLEEMESKSTFPGLITPGDATFTVRIDPADPSHVKLWSLYKARTKVLWAMGWGDGVDIDPTGPAAANEDWELPETRTWSTWRGHISGMNFTGFEAGGAPVQGSVKIKRSTAAEWLVKGRAP